MAAFLSRGGGGGGGVLKWTKWWHTGEDSQLLPPKSLLSHISNLIEILFTNKQIWYSLDVVLCAKRMVV